MTTTDRISEIRERWEPPVLGLEPGTSGDLWEVMRLAARAPEDIAFLLDGLTEVEQALVASGVDYSGLDGLPDQVAFVAGLALERDHTAADLEAVLDELPEGQGTPAERVAQVVRERDALRAEVARIREEVEEAAIAMRQDIWVEDDNPAGHAHYSAIMDALHGSGVAADEAAPAVMQMRPMSEEEQAEALDKLKAFQASGGWQGQIVAVPPAQPMALLREVVDAFADVDPADSPETHALLERVRAVLNNEET